MQKPSERHKSTSDNNIIKFKKPDPFNVNHDTCLHIYRILESKCIDI